MPIDTAPVVPGREFGPCLIWAAEPEDEERWLLGGWSGENWCSEEGLIVTPTGWHPLPAAPERRSP